MTENLTIVVVATINKFNLGDHFYGLMYSSSDRGENFVFTFFFFCTRNTHLYNIKMMGCIPLDFVMIVYEHFRVQGQRKGVVKQYQNFG